MKIYSYFKPADKLYLLKSLNYKNYSLKVKCPTCRGKGFGVFVCSTCYNTGKISKQIQRKRGEVKTLVTVCGDVNCSKIE